MEVLPIEWLVSSKDQKIITKYLILSGIPFVDTHNPIITNFEETYIYKFINNYLVKDMFQHEDSNILIDTDKKEISYPHINKRMEDIKRRIKILKEN